MSKPSSSLRLKLLEAVKGEVTQQLENSLHHAVFRNLLHERQPEQVPRLWDVKVKISNRPTYQLPEKTSITQVFDDAGGKLLILGARGAGKTTTLLEVAGELIARAQNDIEQPIPVLFNLSSWHDSNQTLANWLVAQLNYKYGLSVNFCQQLISSQQLLPLLDGLDELELTRQQQCIQAINKLLAGDNPPKKLVVCTRLEDYKSCGMKLQVCGAVYLRLLTDAQIRDYLLKARSRELWHNINTDPTILGLARTPLLLNMMALADEEILIHSWKRLTSKEECRNYLLNAYIRRMLTQQMNRHWYSRGKEPSPEKIRHWLIWLAQRMKQENQREFLIESMQPSWFQTHSQKRLYSFGFGLICGIILALVCRLLGGLSFGLICGAVGILIGVLIANILGLPHFTMRLILWWKGYIPWNYTRFLNYASEQLLLRKVGRRYLFIHDLLHEHFAQMPVNYPAHASARNDTYT